MPIYHTTASSYGLKENWLPQAREWYPVGKLEPWGGGTFLEEVAHGELGRP